MSFPNPVNVESNQYLCAGRANAHLTEFQFDCKPVNTIEDVLASFQAAANLAAEISLSLVKAEVQCDVPEIPPPDGQDSPFSISITVTRYRKGADVVAVATMADGVSKAIWKGRVDCPLREDLGAGSEPALASSTVRIAELDWLGIRTPAGPCF